MNPSLLALVGFVLLLTEVLLATLFHLDGWSPILFFLFAVWLSSVPLSAVHYVVIASLGFLADGLTGSPAGLHGCIGLVIMLVLPLVTSRLELSRGVGAMLIGAAGALFSLLVAAVLVRQTAHGDSGAGPANLLIPGALWGGLLSPILFPLLDRITSAQRMEKSVNLN